MKIKRIFENNSRWIAEKLKQDAQYFDKLSEGQNPEILYIGCSDSRVTAEEMMGATPGEMFVHRNIANVVSNNDLNLMSVLEYAVNYLQVKHIIVCGHYECGGVKAAMEVEDHGLLNLWLRNIRNVAQMHRGVLNQIKDEGARYKKLVELNTLDNCIKVSQTAIVQKAHAERKIIVHGWVFDIHTGRLIDLEFNIAAIPKDVVDS